MRHFELHTQVTTSIVAHLLPVAWSDYDQDLSTVGRHANRKAVSLRTHDARELRFGGLQMKAQFSVGDRVDHSRRDRFVGTVKAVYVNKEGEVLYAVDMEGHGTLRLCSEHTIVAHNH
jgi:hypothetical protein